MDLVLLDLWAMPWIFEHLVCLWCVIFSDILHFIFLVLTRFMHEELFLA